MDISNQLDDDNTDENKIAAESLIASLEYPGIMLISDVTFSSILAHDSKSLHCIGVENRVMDGITEGLHLHQMYMDLTIEQVTVLNPNIVGAG